MAPDKTASRTYDYALLPDFPQVSVLYLPALNLRVLLSTPIVDLREAGDLINTEPVRNSPSIPVSNYSTGQLALRRPEGELDLCIH